jgi:hypothetical protein
MARKLTIAWLVAGTLALPALAQAEGAIPICTLEARTSVGVTVLDARGAPISDATVTYSVDGEREEECVRFPFLVDGRYICGWETAGTFRITARRGAETATATVSVSRGQCHVRSESVTLRLGSM